MILKNHTMAECRRKVRTASAFLPVVSCLRPASAFRHLNSGIRVQTGTAGHGLVRHWPAMQYCNPYLVLSYCSLLLLVVEVKKSNRLLANKNTTVGYLENWRRGKKYWNPLGKSHAPLPHALLGIHPYMMLRFMAEQLQDQPLCGSIFFMTRIRLYQLVFSYSYKSCFKYKYDTDHKEIKQFLVIIM